MLDDMKKTIEIIVPCHNEEENIKLVYSKIIETITSFEKPYQFKIIFVNDGSKDRTLYEIKKLADKDDRVFYIDFSRNFGHHAAIDAGLVYSESDALIMIDADLQQPPDMIINFIKAWEDGYEIVNTRRIDKDSVGFFKKITAKLFYSLINNVSDIHIEHGSADFRLLDKKVVDVLKELPEKEKFYRGLVNWVGYKVTSFEYEASKRVHGKSSYTIKKMINLAKVGILSFSMLPIKIIIGAGMVLSVFGFLSSTLFFVLYLLNYRYFSGSVILGCFVIMNTGLIITMLGINSVYLYTILRQVEGRPSYIIRETNI